MHLCVVLFSVHILYYPLGWYVLFKLFPRLLPDFTKMSIRNEIISRLAWNAVLLGIVDAPIIRRRKRVKKLIQDWDQNVICRS